MADSLHQYAAKIPDRRTAQAFQKLLDRFFPKATELTTGTADLGSMSSTEIGWLNGVTAGTAAANKALVLGASKEIASVGEITTTEPIVYDAGTTITAFATGGQASATALTAEFNNVTTCATASDSVKLPVAAAGKKITVKNSGATALAVFPATGDAINALAVNLSVDIAVNGQMTFRAIDATTWETEEFLISQAPSTQKGSLVVKAADSAGNTVTTITNASQAAARTYTIPDAGAAASFVMTEGAQTLNGVQTYTLPRLADHNTGITAFATGGQASATALTGEWNNVTTCATAGDSVKLMAAAAGQEQTVKNSGAATLAVFPATGDAINALAANLSVDVAVGSEMTFRAIDATTWETFEVITLPAPTTQKGSLVIQAADSAGNTNTTITNASQAAARTYTIPDAGASASFVMTEGAQTVAGAKSFTGAITTTNGVASGTARKVGGLVKASTNAADSVTAVASNNSFVAFAETYVIPANTINAGTVLKARALVRVSDASGTDTLTVEARVGGTTIVATTAVDPGATTDLHILELEFTGRAAAGAAASCVSSGRWITNTGGTIAHGTGLMGATNFATNGALTVDVRAKWSSNTASTACLLETLSVEVVG